MADFFANIWRLYSINIPAFGFEGVTVSEALLGVVIIFVSIKILELVTFGALGGSFSSKK